MIQGCTKMVETEGGYRFDLSSTGHGEAEAEITFYTPSMFRYRVRATERGNSDKVELVIRDQWGSVDLRSTKTDDRLSIESSDLVVALDINPWRLQVYSSEGKLIAREKPIDVDCQGNRISQPLGFEFDDERPVLTRTTMELFHDEQFYGFGEKFTNLNKRGQTITLWNRNPYGSGSELAYKNIPFYLSTRGYGVFVNTTFRSTYEMGSKSTTAYSIEVEDSELDLYFIYGPSFKSILGQYTELTGKPVIPPKWAFGLWLSVLGEEREGQDVGENGIIDFADQVRARGIPADVIHLDPFWMGDRGYCRFEWGSKYPSPSPMIAALKEKGFRLCLWEHPYIDIRTEMYREGKEKGYFLKRADGSVYDAHLVIAPDGVNEEYREQFYDLGGIVDFSNPEAVEWYKTKHRPLLDMGVATFKTDFGEEIPEDTYFHNGKTGREMHNVYPLLYNKTVFEVINEYYDRSIVWGRSGYAGSQRYPGYWSGDPLTDFPSMISTLRGGLSFGLSGVPFWTHDLGGFKGEPTEAVYVRWTQFGLLTALSRLHGTSTRMPWRYSERACRIFKQYAELRYQLLPYIYSISLQAAVTGLPLLRAMVLEFQNDRATYNLDHQYMFGDSLLVAPVFNEEGEVLVYFPEGKWFDYWTDEAIEGPMFLQRQVPLEELPLYVKADSIIPMAPVYQYVEEGGWDPLSLHVWVDDEAYLTLRDDDGTSEFRATKSPKGIEIDLSLPPGKETMQYNLKVHALEAVSKVTADGRVLECGDVEGGWIFDSAQSLLSINVSIEAPISISIQL